jgi:hypothetical protein
MALVKDSARKSLELAFGVLLVAGGLLFIAVAVRMITYPQEVVITEGAIREAVCRLALGHNIYDISNLQHPPFLVAQYPPLFYLVTGALVRLFGESFWPGRLVSSFSSLATALILGLVVRRKSGSRPFGVAAALVYLSFYHVVMWGTTHRVDSLGVLLSVGGVALYERAREAGPGRARLWIAAVLFAGALLTKQVLVAGAAAVTIDLLIERRWGRAAGLAAAILVPFGAVFLALDLAAGGGFRTMTVLGTVSAAADPPWTIFLNAGTFFGSAFILATLVVCLFLLLRNGRPDIWGLMVLFGLPWAIVTDANIPRFMEPLAAMAVVLCVGLAVLRRRESAEYAIAMVLLVFALAVSFLYEERVTIVRERLMNLHAGNSRDRFAEVLARHSTPGGAVLAQDLGVVLGAGRRVYLNDPYVFSMLRGNGAWEPDDLVEGARRRRFEAIVLNRPVESLRPDEWTTLWIHPAADAIKENYVLAETLTSAESYRFYEPTRYFYVPRP